ncbi:MAG: helix-turn-helix transcriptional regulator [Brevundimonas sp.]|nr:helix-turn-helix transcriptional regulator [Brevundimonas sp.]
MNDPSAADRYRLDRLTPGEREVLVMLARGHTAKTIATSLGLSVAAVNERLRGARRRTGAGSSRELARLLAQQNRDEFSELAATGGPVLRAGEPAPKGRWNTRRNVMIASAALAAVLAATMAPGLLSPAQQAAPDRSGPEAAIIARLSAGPNPQQLRDRLQAEERDEAWAPRIEAGIRERYGRLPVATRSLERLSVACRSTLCEVVGRTRSGATSDDITAVLAEVQSGELNDSIEQLGLQISASSFTAATGSPQGVVFVAHLQRR